MSVIRRQGIKHSLVNYLGVVLGAFSTFYIYQLSDETYDFYALAQGIISAAMLVLPFATLGMTNLIIRFFPQFEEKNNHHNGFLAFLLMITTVSILLFFAIASLVLEPLYSGLEAVGFDTQVFRQYGWVIIILCIVIAYSAIFENFAKNFNRIAVQAIFTYLLPKIALPTLVILLYIGYLNEWQAAIGLPAFYAIGLIGLAAYVVQIGQFNLQPKFQFLQKPLLREMGVYALYGILGSLGSMLALRIDALMVLSLIGKTETSTYSIAYFMANVIAIPGGSIIAIASPILAQSWAKNDIANIGNIYQKSSITLGAIGLGIFLLIAISIDQLFALMPKGEAASLGKYVFYMIGFSKIIDLLTSVNGQIISFSKHFHFNLIAISILAVLNVFLNYFFIRTLGLGINGAALATLVSLFLYNLIKLIFIWVKFGIQPFSMNTLYLFAIFGVLLLLGMFFPAISIAAFPEKLVTLLNIGLKCALIGIVYLGLLYWTRTAPEINKAIELYNQKALEWLKP